jgi:hypothetical protein
MTLTLKMRTSRALLSKIIHSSLISFRRWAGPLAGLCLLASLSAACGAALPGQAPATQASQTPTAAPARPLPEAMVTLHVQLPAETPLREPIFLTVLDEVTGLALNVQRYEMQAADDLNYEISLPFPLGATIKYRYSRQGTYTAEEHTSDKRPVRYRMFHVEGPGSVNDVISVWSDQAFTGSTGRIMGTATDAQTGAPIPDLLVTAGGSQTLTTSDGSFLLEGLPPGTHNLVAYALEGTYRTFQQGAIVAADSTTPAKIQLSQAPAVKVVFTVVVPSGTMPAVPIRMAGNLYQLGNTFADLAGGMSTLAARMPALTPLPDGRYSLAINLPAGAHIYYKYTLGDGFWNAEQSAGGQLRLRHFIVPDAPTVVEDRVESWGGGEGGPILFDLTVPGTTPAADMISIQFNPYGWTEPIPMWFLGENHWVYILYGPLAGQEKLGYRYCRNDQCGSADDAQTQGNDSFGRILEIAGGQQTVQDTLDAWAWLNPDASPFETGSPQVRGRGAGFVAGFEFQPSHHPSWTPRDPVALREIQSLGANWVVLSPTWTYTRLAPPVLEPVAGRNPLWPDLTAEIQRARAFNLNVALNPAPQFPLPVDEWWASAPGDFAWWTVWFERYRSFALHHADLAQSQGAQGLILGGDWISPALPGGLLASGAPSGIPDDAETRWRDLLAEVRSHFSGALIWALPFTPGQESEPPFLEAVDQIYLLWSVPLSDRPDASEQDLQDRAAALLDEEVKSLQERVGKPLVLAIAYPSADGGVAGCLPDPLATISGACLDLSLLARPNADIPSLALDLEEQAQAYAALLAAINERDWISGFISRGYFPPAALQDKSTSVHGKPAADLLGYWFPRLLESNP